MFLLISGFCSLRGWVSLLTKFRSLIMINFSWIINKILVCISPWFGEVDDCSFFNYLNPFCFLLIEFHQTFSISYNILPYFVYYYCILSTMSYAVGTYFFRARFASFHTHASLLTFFVCFFILFRSCCSHARVFGKTHVHEFPMSYSHTEWYLLLSRGEIVFALAEASPIKI